MDEKKSSGWPAETVPIDMDKAAEVLQKEFDRQSEEEGEPRVRVLRQGEADPLPPYEEPEGFREGAFNGLAVDQKTILVDRPPADPVGSLRDAVVEFSKKWKLSDDAVIELCFIISNDYRKAVEEHKKAAFVKQSKLSRRLNRARKAHKRRR